MKISIQEVTHKMIFTFLEISCLFRKFSGYKIRFSMAYGFVLFDRFGFDTQILFF